MTTERLVSMTARCPAVEYFVTETPEKLKNEIEMTIPKAQIRIVGGVTISVMALRGEVKES